MRATFRLSLAMAALLLFPAAVLAQAEITALSADSDPIDSSDQLRLSRFADFSEETTVAVGAELEIGDLLTSVADAIDVELGCGEDTVLRFSGGFRILIATPEETACAIDLLSGTIDVLTDAPAEIEAGDVTLGVEGTQFSLALTRSEDGPDRDLSVFEGRVRVRSGTLDDEVETGRTWRKARGEPVWGEVTTARSERTADLFARLDVAKSVAAGEEIADRKDAVAKLRELHLEVLTRPDDNASRVELAKAQLAVARDNFAAYHLKHADVTTEEELERYDIDKRVLSRIEQIRLAPGLPSRKWAPQPTVSRKPAADPFILIQRGDYQEAIDILLERAKDEPTSKVYCALAKAYSGLDGAASRRAKAHADRGLKLHTTDRKLSRAELGACRRMGSGYSP